MSLYRETRVAGVATPESTSTRLTTHPYHMYVLLLAVVLPPLTGGSTPYFPVSEPQGKVVERRDGQGFQVGTVKC